jgi:hypothetical protein
MTYEQNEKLENAVRVTIVLPLSLSIKLEADKQSTNDSRSSWIRKAIEEKLSRVKEGLSVQDELKFLKEEVKKLKEKNNGMRRFVLK